MILIKDLFYNNILLLNLKVICLLNNEFKIW